MRPGQSGCTADGDSLVLDSLVTVIPNAVRDLERAVNAK
jgi:hypothetical protein